MKIRVGCEWFEEGKCKAFPGAYRCTVQEGFECLVVAQDRKRRMAMDRDREDDEAARAVRSADGLFEMCCGIVRRDVARIKGEHP